MQQGCRDFSLPDGFKKIAWEGSCEYGRKLLPWYVINRILQVEELEEITGDLTKDRNSQTRYLRIEGIVSWAVIRTNFLDWIEYPCDQLEHSLPAVVNTDHGSGP